MGEGKVSTVALQALNNVSNIFSTTYSKVCWSSGLYNGILHLQKKKVLHLTVRLSHPSKKHLEIVNEY